MIVKTSQCFQKLFDDKLISLTVIPYTDALLISLGSKGLLGFIHESSCNTSAGLHLPISHRIMLGDRDDLVTSVFAQKLAEEVIQLSGTRRVVLSLSLEEKTMKEREKSKVICQWVLDCLQSV